jgi:hypothetical protein
LGWTSKVSRFNYSLVELEPWDGPTHFPGERYDSRDGGEIFSLYPFSSLHHKNIYTLDQALKTSDNSPFMDYYLRSNEIGLSSDLANEWDHFRKELMDFGAYLQNHEDTLLWTGGDHSGIPTIKNFYWAILSTKNLRKFGGWHRAMWKWKIQLKIKLFIWLAVEGKILTWDIIHARGREGPRICYLGKHDSEIIDHLPYLGKHESSLSFYPICMEQGKNNAWL